MIVIVNNIYNRENGIEFSHVNIQELLKNKIYSSNFYFGFKGKRKIKIDLLAESHEKCKENVEYFLQTKLNENEFTFHIQKDTTI